ncbi:MAG: invasion associated locus B family protein [Pseudomonadota bacterium]
MTTSFSLRRAVASALLCTAIAGLASPAPAETRVDAKADWSVFKSDGGGRECWIVSAPTGWKATRGGTDVTSQVRRGDILLMVAVRPDDSVTNEISYTSGYPFRSDSSVKVEIGDDAHELFTEGEWGWLSSPDEDNAMVEDMKRGLTATLTAVSTRGTQTVDTFSLRGFTAALDAARELCR